MPTRGLDFMQKIMMTRYKSDQSLTRGVMTLPSGKELFTLELPWHSNASAISCIPVGEYTCKLVNSPRFGTVFEITGVENRSHILIHAGNTTQDTSGCVLVGCRTCKDGLLESRKALDLLMGELKEDFTLIIQ